MLYLLFTLVLTRPNVCSDNTEKNACYGSSGCFWHPTTNECAHLGILIEAGGGCGDSVDMQSCTDNTECIWNSNDGSCLTLADFRTPTTCEEITDESTCWELSNCFYNQRIGGCSDIRGEGAKLDTAENAIVSSTTAVNIADTSTTTFVSTEVSTTTADPSGAEAGGEAGAEGEGGESSEGGAGAGAEAEPGAGAEAEAEAETETTTTAIQCSGLDPMACDMKTGCDYTPLGCIVEDMPCGAFRSPQTCQFAPHDCVWRMNVCVSDEYEWAEKGSPFMFGNGMQPGIRLVVNTGGGPGGIQGNTDTGRGTIDLSGSKFGLTGSSIYGLPSMNLYGGSASGQPMNEDMMEEQNEMFEEMFGGGVAAAAVTTLRKSHQSQQIKERPWWLHTDKLHLTAIGLALGGCILGCIVMRSILSINSRCLRDKSPDLEEHYLIAP